MVVRAPILIPPRAWCRIDSVRNMKLLFSSPQSPEVTLLKDVLDQAGVPCEVRNENLYSNFPSTAFQPEIWVLNDDDYPKACEVRDSCFKSGSENRGPWTCPACGEESEGQFGRCWKCG